MWWKILIAIGVIVILFVAFLFFVSEALEKYFYYHHNYD